MEAEASFKLAVWFQQRRQADPRDEVFERAQQLNPDDWNYHRQEWSFTPEEAGQKWLEKFRRAGCALLPDARIEAEEEVRRLNLKP